MAHDLTELPKWARHRIELTEMLLVRARYRLRKRMEACAATHPPGDTCLECESDRVALEGHRG